MKLSDIRKEYTLKSLDISDVSMDPFRQFSLWFDEAVDSEALEVNAMCLSTLGLDGYPSGRIVLLKGVDEGFVFFTNYSSTKGKEIEAMPKASLTFFWAELERQVRIVGDLEKISEKESDEYFFPDLLALKSVLGLPLKAKKLKIAKCSQKEIKCWKSDFPKSQLPGHLIGEDID